MGFNEQQRALVLRYFQTGKKEQSAIDVGYAPSGAASQAYKILRLPEAQALLEELRATAAEAVGITKEGLLRELKLIIESDQAHYRINEDGHIELADDAPPEASRALSRVKLKKTVKTDGDGNEYETVDAEFGLWSKNDAIAKAMKHLGMLDEKVEHNVSLSWSDLMKADADG